MAKGESLNLNICLNTQKEKDDMSIIPYSQVIGCLIYTTMYTLLYISYDVGMVSSYQSNPGRLHGKAVKRVLR